LMIILKIVSGHNIKDCFHNLSTSISTSMFSDVEECLQTFYLEGAGASTSALTSAAAAAA